MKKFLEYVAEDIIQKYGTDLSRIAIVFPNKRASLFLNEMLARKAGKPIWSPAYVTISEFFVNTQGLWSEILLSWFVTCIRVLSNVQEQMRR